jgi:hypothetical protein
MSPSHQHQDDMLACFEKKSSIMPLSPRHQQQDDKLACFQKTSKSKTSTTKRGHRRTLPIGVIIDQAALCLLVNKKTKHRRSSPIFDNTSERLIIELFFMTFLACT